MFERLEKDAIEKKKLAQKREADRLASEVEGMTFQVTRGACWW